MRKFLNDERGFVTVAMALLLPVIFAVCGLAFDLGRAMKNQALMHDALREGSFLLNASETADPKTFVEKIQNLTEIYNPGAKISDIHAQKVRQKSSDSAGEASFFVVSAKLANNGVFTNFLNAGDSGSLTPDVAKFENATDLAYTDFVFAMAFTDSAASPSSLNEAARKILCDAPKIIKYGVCNSGIGSGKAAGIDASQTVVAHLISLAKNYDRGNHQNFGFVPFSNSSQVLGKNLTPEARVDTEDGSTRAERDSAKYAVHPIDFFLFGDMDHYGRFYEKEGLAQNFESTLYYSMKRSGAQKNVLDLFIGSDKTVRDFVFDRYTLSDHNNFTAHLRGRHDAESALNEIYQKNSPIGLLEGNFRIQTTLENIFSEAKQTVYRLYDPKIDEIKIIGDVNGIKNKSKQYQKILGEYLTLVSQLKATQILERSISAGRAASKNDIQTTKTQKEAEEKTLYEAVATETKKIDTQNNFLQYFVFGDVCVQKGKCAGDKDKASRFSKIFERRLNTPEKKAQAKNVLKKVKTEYRPLEAVINAADQILKLTSFSTLGAILDDLQTKVRTKKSEYEALRRELDNSIFTRGKALCNSFLLFTGGDACQKKAFDTLDFTEIPLRKIKNTDEISQIPMIYEKPFKELSRGKYKTGVSTDKDYGSVGLMRAALMLMNSPSKNTSAKIMLFTSSTHENDEKLIDAGLCQILKTRLKERRGINVKIYAVTLGLPDRKIGGKNVQTAENYKRVWGKCADFVITGDTVDTLFTDVQRAVFDNSFGKFTFDPLKN